MIPPPPDSQVAALPDAAALPFKLISKTIGMGAYASIRKAVPTNKTGPVIAVKFINKEHAFRHGRVTNTQLRREISLHKYLGKHHNIIQFWASGEDKSWTWIAMELADGGDLFDKIDPDAGCGEDIAHFYFCQLVNAVSYMHQKGVAHRDIKPENVLLSANGDLKLADFGLAALFEKDGQTRTCNTVCGSPPYMAPEVLGGRKSMRPDVLDDGYAPNISDIWGCGVVLFVLLAGNTPWDEPTTYSEEFKEFVALNGRLPDDELWRQLPPEMDSLIQGMLRLNPASRSTIEDIRSHPWFQRKNKYLSSTGRSANPVGLATDMLCQLRIDFNKPITSSTQYSSQSMGSTQNPDAMDIDSSPHRSIASPHRHQPSHPHENILVASTQPETPIGETQFDWERPQLPASQPLDSRMQGQVTFSQLPLNTQDLISQDPTLSQFSEKKLTPDNLMTLTQAARAFKDIIPPFPLSRFLSPLSISELFPRIISALVHQGVPTAAVTRAQIEQWDSNGKASIRVKMIDARKQNLNGHVVVERISMWESDMSEVRFVKASGDPLEWRRFFKNVVVLMGEKGIVRPEG